MQFLKIMNTNIDVVSQQTAFSAFHHVCNYIIFACRYKLNDSSVVTESGIENEKNIISVPSND